MSLLGKTVHISPPSGSECFGLHLSDNLFVTKKRKKLPAKLGSDRLSFHTNLNYHAAMRAYCSMALRGNGALWASIIREHLKKNLQILTRKIPRLVIFFSIFKVKNDLSKFAEKEVA